MAGGQNEGIALETLLILEMTKFLVNADGDAWDGGMWHCAVM